MKKLFVILFAVCTLSASLSAQDYKTAGGLFIDFGDGATFVGPHVKHFFNNDIAAQAMVLFGSGVTAIGLEGSYNAPIPGASGFAWNIGFGPQALIGSGNTAFVLRPSAGLEYTIPKTPVNIGIDWRPAWSLSNGSSFTAGRFGLALRYTFK